MTDPPDTAAKKSPAQVHVEALLTDLVAPGTPYRTATLVLTYRQGTDEKIVNFGHGTALQSAKSGSLDLVMLVPFLHALAERLNAVVHGQFTTLPAAGVTEMDGRKGTP